MFRNIHRMLARLVCRHRYRPSRTWPGVKVCERCGYRKPGDV